MKEYIIIIFILLIVLIIKSHIDQKNNEKRIIQKLKDDWGKLPEEEFTQEKFNSITHYYKSHLEKSLDIDDITWNDINMDDIFMLINNTQSAIGEEYLYYILRKPCFDDKKLKERERLIQFFLENEEKRIEIQRAFKHMGKLINISISEYINRTDNIDTSKTYIHYMCIFALISSFLFSFINPQIGITATAIMIVYNIITYYKRKAQIDSYLTVFIYVMKLLNNTDKILELNISEIKQYNDILKQTQKNFKKFKKKASFVMGGNDMTGGLFDAIFDYIRMLFHIDLIQFDKMLNVMRSNKEDLNRTFEVIGLLDSMIAAASFRVLMKDYCIPELVNKKELILEVKNVYHPMIINPIKNSIKQSKSVLLTGSNASGKSTFLKTIAINAILAQTINTSLSDSYKANYFKVYSSMALKDNIVNNESYYIVEIKSLKRIIDNIDNDIPMLCFIDEVLRGTNTIERIAASSQILKNISLKNTICFAATHDIELTHMLEKYYTNYHFEEHVKDNMVLFDYLLHIGRATSRNAIQLLSIIGYSNDIIKNAQDCAEDFLKNNIWKTL